MSYRASWSLLIIALLYLFGLIVFAGCAGSAIERPRIVSEQVVSSHAFCEVFGLADSTGQTIGAELGRACYSLDSLKLPAWLGSFRIISRQTIGDSLCQVVMLTDSVGRPIAPPVRRCLSLDTLARSPAR